MAKCFLLLVLLAVILAACAPVSQQWIYLYDAQGRAVHEFCVQGRPFIDEACVKFTTCDGTVMTWRGTYLLSTQRLREGIR